MGQLVALLLLHRFQSVVQILKWIDNDRELMLVKRLDCLFLPISRWFCYKLQQSGEWFLKFIIRDFLVQRHNRDKSLSSWDNPPSSVDLFIKPMPLSACLDSLLIYTLCASFMIKIIDEAPANTNQSQIYQKIVGYINRSTVPSCILSEPMPHASIETKEEINHSGRIFGHCWKFRGT